MFSRGVARSPACKLPNSRGAPVGQYRLYSKRNACTGSSLAALLAGQIPKNKPTPTDTTIPEIAAQAGTVTGSEVNTILLIIAIAQPSPSPATPPRPAKTEIGRAH